MSKKKTPAQNFADIFRMHVGGSTEHERDNAKGRAESWLKRHGKAWKDIPEILAQAGRDDDAQKPPPPPPPDPRANDPHPFDDPKFTPLGIVYEAVGRYLYMTEHVRVIYSAWAVYTHVHPQFKIAPRLAFTSEFPDCGKSAALDVLRCLVLRPNPEALGTGAAVRSFLSEGPCTALLDELDMVDEDARRELLRVWNLGHRVGAHHSMIVKGQRVLQNLFAPAAGAGLGGFLGSSQKSRTYSLEMVKFTAETKPPLDFYSETHYPDLDAVYSYLRHWASTAKLNLKPPIPEGLLGRHADNLRGLISVSDACGGKWRRRACEAIRTLYARERAERPEIVILRHGLAIFERLGVDQIDYWSFNRELKRLDLPDARWTRYRGPAGFDLAHMIEPNEQGKLLAKVGIETKQLWTPGPRSSAKKFRGYARNQFEEAWRIHGAVAPGGGSEPARMHLVPPAVSESE
jgi:Protein of unknown function (DUF3631)